MLLGSNAINISSIGAGMGMLCGMVGDVNVGVRWKSLGTSGT